MPRDDLPGGLSAKVAPPFPRLDGERASRPVAQEIVSVYAQSPRSQKLPAKPTSPRQRRDQHAAAPFLPPAAPQEQAARNALVVRLEDIRRAWLDFMQRHQQQALPLNCQKQKYLLLMHWLKVIFQVHLN